MAKAKSVGLADLLATEAQPVDVGGGRVVYMRDLTTAEVLRLSRLKGESSTLEGVRLAIQDEEGEPLFEEKSDVEALPIGVFQKLQEAIVAQIDGGREALDEVAAGEA